MGDKGVRAMIYKVRERIFSIGDHFTIEDEKGVPHFYVRGRVFSIGNKLSLEDMNGNELCFIEQKLLRLLPEYTLYFAGRAAATVKKTFTLLRPKFTISSIYGNFEIEGDPWSHNFSIVKDGKLAAEVSKRWFSMSDTYGVDVAESEEPAFILALVIVIDQTLHDRKN
jgi:uncharacterized protein YxjI